MKKRILSIGLVLCSLFSFVPIIFAATNIDTASTWAHDGIQEAVAKGFVPTDLQNNYTNIITRQEFCRMAVKWLEYALNMDIDMILTMYGLSRDTNAFTDTDNPDILAAFAFGITSGVGNNRFNPNGSFTREQAATMIMNTCIAAFMDSNDDEDSGFEDIADASDWALDGINFVFNYGIMQGTGNNNFNPKAAYTREQSIITFNNIDFDKPHNAWHGHSENFEVF